MTPTDNAPNPGLVFALASAHQQTAALTTAIQLDIFGAIGQGFHDVPSIAKHAAASERGIRILCDYLVISQLLQKVDGLYQHSPTSAVFLDPASPASLASIFRFLNNPQTHDVFQQLPEIVRTGRTTLPGDGSVEPDHPMWVDFAEGMVPMMRPLAGPFASHVLSALSGPIKVLDIAAGHGLYGIEIAKQNPEAHITGLDWPKVLDVAVRNAQSAGVDARYTRLPGSAFDLEFAGPYDAVLLTNFLHHFDQPTCITLLKKVHAALRPGGVAATLEFVPNDDRISPAPAASFAMTMLATTVRGDAYTFSEYESMYSAAGFSSITQHPIAPSPETVILGRA